MDLRIRVVQTLTDAGPNVDAAAREVLRNTDIDGYLAYLHDGLYAARELDCAAQPTPTPTDTPTATPTDTPTATPTDTPTGASTSASPADPGTTGGEGGGLAVTGADTATAAGIGGALLLLGGAGYVIGRRRRTRFQA